MENARWENGNFAVATIRIILQKQVPTIFSTSKKTKKAQCHVGNFAMAPIREIFENFDHFQFIKEDEKALCHDGNFANRGKFDMGLGK